MISEARLQPLKNIYEDVEGQSEDALQQKCFFWFTNEYPKHRKKLFAVPNGGYRNKREAKKLKQTGVVSGVSDLILLTKGIANLLELKTETGIQSDEQIEWQSIMEDEGFDYYLIKNLLTFKKVVTLIIEKIYQIN